MATGRCPVEIFSLRLVLRCEGRNVLLGTLACLRALTHETRRNENQKTITPQRHGLGASVVQLPGPTTGGGLLATSCFALRRAECTSGYVSVLTCPNPRNKT